MAQGKTTVINQGLAEEQALAELMLDDEWPSFVLRCSMRRCKLKIFVKHFAIMHEVKSKRKEKKK